MSAHLDTQRNRPMRAVAAGIENLTSTIRELWPERIFVVKKSIEEDVREAASAAGYAGGIVVLPFPVRQWRKAFVGKLAAELAGRLPQSRPP